MEMVATDKVNKICRSTLSAKVGRAAAKVEAKASEKMERLKEQAKADASDVSETTLLAIADGWERHVTSAARPDTLRKRACRKETEKAKAEAKASAKKEKDKELAKVSLQERTRGSKRVVASRQGLATYAKRQDTKQKIADSGGMQQL